MVHIRVSYISGSFTSSGEAGKQQYLDKSKQPGLFLSPACLLPPYSQLLTPSLTPTRGEGLTSGTWFLLAHCFTHLGVVPEKSRNMTVIFLSYFLMFKSAV